jgi:hypothetical protein
MLGDSRPIMDASAAQWINPQPELRIADDLHVNNAAKIGDVGAEIVAPVRGRGAQSFFDREFVSPLLAGLRAAHSPSPQSNR